MKQASAAMIKRGRRGAAPPAMVPRGGSRLREVFDALQANRGKPVKLGRLAPGIMVSLRDFYGLDIREVPGSRKLGSGKGHGTAPATWVLAGEWAGRAYIDYVAERMEAGQ